MHGTKQCILLTMGLGAIPPRCGDRSTCAKTFLPGTGAGARARARHSDVRISFAANRCAESIARGTRQNAVRCAHGTPQWQHTAPQRVNLGDGVARTPSRPLLQIGSASFTFSACPPGSASLAPSCWSRTALAVAKKNAPPGKMPLARAKCLVIEPGHFRLEGKELLTRDATQVFYKVAETGKCQQQCPSRTILNPSPAS